MANTNETMNTTVNTEMTEMAEVANEAVKMARIDMKTVAEIGIGAAIVGGIAYGVKKLAGPKIKKMHENRKAKKLEKKLKKSAEVDIKVE